MAASKSKDPWAATASPAGGGGGGGWGANDGGWGGGGADKGGWGGTKDDEWGDAGWGETAARGGGGGGWGDTRSAAGGWGDNKPTAGGWGDTKSNGAWGAEPTNPPAGGGWGSMGDSGAGGWGTPQSGPSDLKKKSNVPRTQDTGYIMPSKTLTHAQKGTNVPLQFVDPHNKLNEYTNVKFVESGGEALRTVARAFFGKDRKARERFRWSFSPDKDPRVSSVLDWIDAVSYSLGAFGLHKFLQSQERGALVVNAAYRAPKNPNEPAFDWITFDQSQKTKDKILQESIALYDPTDRFGNSVAIWRRKINIPNNIKLMLQAEIQTVLAGLRREEDYVVHVDEIPGPAPQYMASPRTRRGSIPPLYTAPDGVLSKKQKLPKDPNKKKRPWWKIF
ncbi:hypothetical protein CPB85DRAFT_1251185 [Mucidula mucida]|nr:hypothetical protein CPB85DRAFT_1251185 [Mucidula mucida]